jgi:hypothetical protein
MSTAGRKDDQEKHDMDLLSPHALEKIAQVMTYGKKKYGANNWRGGIAYSRLLAAVMRHINSYRKGETLDPETGLSHLSHASCGLMMLLEFEETRPELNDLFFSKPATNLLEYTPKRLPKFAVGDVVKHINNDVEVTVQGTYWDEKDNAILFVKDDDNKIFGVDPNFYKSIYADEVKSGSD